MNSSVRQNILKGNALFLGLFGAVSFFMLDVRGIWFSSGPQTAVLRGEPASVVGFLEAHGLAVVIAVWLWRASRTENPRPRLAPYFSHCAHTPCHMQHHPVEDFHSLRRPDPRLRLDIFALPIRYAAACPSPVRLPGRVDPPLRCPRLCRGGLAAA